MVSGFDPEYPEQLTNVSYGYGQEGDTQTPHYFSTPTPGTANGLGDLGWVKPVAFSHKRGFYERPFELILCTETQDAEIRLTLDGSAPSAIHGSIYTHPLSITETSVVRAAAVKPGYLDARVVTSTFLFLDDIVRQSLDGRSPGPDWPDHVNDQRLDYGLDPGVVNHSSWGSQLEEALLAIPTMSLVTDLRHLFDAQTGIYVNTYYRGRDWERPMSLELIYPPNPQGAGFPDLIPVDSGVEDGPWILPDDMLGGFQINAGMRIRGGYSRTRGNPKHAFRFFFRNEYGPGALEYPLFGEEGTDRFDKIDLRTSQNYSWSFNYDPANTMCREVWARDTQGLMGQPYTRSRYYHLYINGQYWGLFQTQERSEASFGAAYLGGKREEYDTIKSTGSDGGFFGGYQIEATDGSMTAWRSLWSLTKAVFGSNVHYCRALGLNPDGTRNLDYPVLLDIDNLIDYMILVFYNGDRDAPISNFLGNQRPNNWYGIRNRNSEEGFRFFVHDAEHIMSRGMLDRTGPFPAGDDFPYSNPQWIHQELMAHPDYCMRFADRAHKLLFDDGLLTPQRAIDRMEARAQQIDMAIIAESARWGSLGLSKAAWRRAVNVEKDNFFPGRTEVLIGQLKRTRLRDNSPAPLYPDLAAASFSLEGGQVVSGATLAMNADQGMIYYTLDGSDPRRSEVASTQTLIPEQSGKRLLVLSEKPDAAFWSQWTQPDFDDTSWESVTGSLGFDSQVGIAGLQDLYDVDIESRMLGVNSSCLVRIPFTVDTPDWSSLILNVRYDDGFVAFLNETQIVIANFTSRRGDPPKWNSTATEDRPHSLAGNLESFDISDYSHLLREGTNVIAPQGLNRSRSDSDFLLSVQLFGQETGSEVGDTAMVYQGPLSLERSAQVKARVYDGIWSALKEATFAVGQMDASLIITEIMYHPLETDDPQTADAEFIELRNNGSETIDTSLVQFTDGIRFTFPSTTLAPGEYALVVKEVTAFESVYGLGHPIAGSYEGSLSNGGERIVLEDAIGRVIADFTYDDRWYRETDGQGYSLTLVEPIGFDPAALSQQESWRASQNLGGSPGY